MCLLIFGHALYLCITLLSCSQLDRQRYSLSRKSGKGTWDPNTSVHFNDTIQMFQFRPSKGKTI